MGIDYRLHGLSFLDAINAIPVNPKLETLLKAKRYDLLSHWYSLRYKVSSYWPSIKICLRNKYKIKDASMWFDYLDLLARYHKDLHNAYLCLPYEI